MAFPVVSVNYWAVLVAGIAAMVFGMLWYGPLFGKGWMKLMGISAKTTMRGKLSPAQSMSIGFITTLVTAYVLAHFVKYAAATTIAESSLLAFWLWLGFLMPLTLGSFIWENKPFKLFLLNTAHGLIGLIIMAAILALWP